MQEESLGVLFSSACRRQAILEVPPERLPRRAVRGFGGAQPPSNRFVLMPLIFRVRYWQLEGSDGRPKSSDRRISAATSASTPRPTPTTTKWLPRALRWSIWRATLLVCGCLIFGRLFGRIVVDYMRWRSWAVAGFSDRTPYPTGKRSDGGAVGKVCRGCE